MFLEVCFVENLPPLIAFDQQQITRCLLFLQKIMHVSGVEALLHAFVKMCDG